MAGTTAKIQVEGRRELTRALKAAGESAGAFREIHQRLAVPLRMAGQLEAPVGPSGQLAGSVRTSATQRALSLRAGSRTVPYAGPIHYGWPRRGIVANPFLERARDSMSEQLAEGYRRHVAELVDRVERDSWNG